MTQAVTKPQISLEDFLAMPETEPASEYIDGKIIQKPMAQGKHCELQWALVSAIRNAAQPDEIAYAVQELRCVFGGRAIVPDVAVFLWDRVPFDKDGEVPNEFMLAPDWAIKILSPAQSPTKPIDKLVHCLQQGAQVGWLVDPDERAITGFLPNQLPTVMQGSDQLPVPPVIPLELTVEQVFGWLRVGRH
ncbi:MAG: Uma2 family endonuclease [Cyanobacteria bacterium J06626_18]